VLPFLRAGARINDQELGVEQPVGDIVNHVFELVLTLNLADLF